MGEKDGACVDCFCYRAYKGFCLFLPLGLRALVFVHFSVLHYCGLF